MGVVILRGPAVRRKEKSLRRLLGQCRETTLGRTQSHQLLSTDHLWRMKHWKIWKIRHRNIIEEQNYRVDWYRKNLEPLSELNVISVSQVSSTRCSLTGKITLCVSGKRSKCLAAAHDRDKDGMSEDRRIESLEFSEAYDDMYLGVKREYNARSDALTAERRRLRKEMDQLLKRMKAHSEQHLHPSPVDRMRPIQTPKKKDSVLLTKASSAPAARKRKAAPKSRSTSTVTQPSTTKSAPTNSTATAQYDPFAGGVVPNRNDVLAAGEEIPLYRRSTHLYWKENGDLMTLGAINRARKAVRYQPFNSLPEAWLHKEKGNQLAEEGKRLGAPLDSDKSSGGKAPRHK